MDAHLSLTWDAAAANCLQVLFVRLIFSMCLVSGTEPNAMWNTLWIRSPNTYYMTNLLKAHLLYTELHGLYYWVCAPCRTIERQSDFFIIILGLTYNRNLNSPQLKPACKSPYPFMRKHCVVMRGGRRQRERERDSQAVKDRETDIEKDREWVSVWVWVWLCERERESMRLRLELKASEQVAHATIKLHMRRPHHCRNWRARANFDTTIMKRYALIYVRNDKFVG